jgi:leucine-rich repeat transmembrane neuronal protein 1/2
MFPSGLVLPSVQQLLCFFLQADFFAFELLNGHIYFHLDLGSGGVKVKATTRRVDDGVWHEATLRRAGKEGRVTVDGTAADFSTPGNGTISLFL